MTRTAAEHYRTRSKEGYVKIPSSAAEAEQYLRVGFMYFLGVDHPLCETAKELVDLAVTKPHHLTQVIPKENTNGQPSDQP